MIADDAVMEGIEPQLHKLDEEEVQLKQKEWRITQAVRLVEEERCEVDVS